MGEGLSYFGLVMPLAQAMGPALGLSLRDGAGYEAAFLGAGLAVVVSLICVIALPYEEKAAAESGGEKRSLQFRDIFALEFLGLMLLTALFSSANGLVSTYLDILAGERSIANISLFFTIYSVALVISKPLTGKLLDKKGLYFVVVPRDSICGFGHVFNRSCRFFGMDACSQRVQGAGTGSWHPPPFRRTR